MPIHLFVLASLLARLLTSSVRQVLKVLRSLFPAFDRWCTHNFPKFERWIRQIVDRVLMLLGLILLCVVRFIWHRICAILFYDDRKQAENPNTPSEKLDTLAESLDRGTRQRVTQNPNSSPTVLFQLGETFPQALLSNPVFDLLLLETPNLLETIPFKTRTSLLKQPSLPIALLEQAAQSNGIYLEDAIAIVNHPKFKAHMIDSLSCYYDHLSFAKALIQRKDLDLPDSVLPAMLTRLAQDPEVSSRRLVARHSRTPVTILEQLKQDENWQVRRSAIATLRKHQ